MLKYSHKFGIRFAPDNGVPGGGPSPSQPGASQTPPEPKDPFKGIDLDSLDEETRKQVEAAKTEFATLQSQKAKAEEEARKHQSEHDKAVAERNKLQQRLQPQAEPKQETTAERIQKQLEANGIDPTVAAKQAAVLGQVLDAERAEIKKQMGLDLAPVVNLTLMREATEAFNYARATDRAGWSTNHEVCTAVWATAEQMVAEGRQVTADVITNLAGMHWLNYAQKNGGHFATLQPGQPQPGNGNPNYVQPTVPNMSTGGYPGSHLANVQMPQRIDPNAPKYQLDAATNAALEAVKAHWSKDAGKPAKGGLV